MLTPDQFNDNYARCVETERNSLAHCVEQAMKRGEKSLCIRTPGPGREVALHAACAVRSELARLGWSASLVATHVDNDIYPHMTLYWSA